jgi:hypothetical protein
VESFAVHVMGRKRKKAHQKLRLEQVGQGSQVAGGWGALDDR